jgi:undecaprenyl-diphosphatase
VATTFYNVCFQVTTFDLRSSRSSFQARTYRQNAKTNQLGELLAQQVDPRMQQFSLWQVLVLAVVQGVTEFLPISSDGHLALVEPLIWTSSSPRPESMDLTIILHLGTLGSILVYYRRRIVELLSSDRRVLWPLFVGTIPAVVVVLVCKLLLDEQFERYLKSVFLTGLMLPVRGAALLFASYHRGGERHYRDFHFWDALLIGIAQATAILPGLSRSGSTITAALLRGGSRSSAATFSFLLAIPALTGAGAYEGLKLAKHGASLSATPAHLVAGAVMAFVVGLVALSLLVRLLERGRLHYCGWYCIGLGLFVAAINWPR